MGSGFRNRKCKIVIILTLDAKEGFCYYLIIQYTSFYQMHLREENMYPIIDYDQIEVLSQKGEGLTDEICHNILESPDIDLLSLLHTAYKLRKAVFGNEVMLHIINNVQNGFCPEDCHYCAQAKTADTDINRYPTKSKEEILSEAKRAYESGAYRYCMVMAGRGPSPSRVAFLAEVIRDIKKQYPLQICVSTGILDEEKAQILKDAGLDRLNHNLNTSESHYSQICTTHTYADRIHTLKAAHQAGIGLCSGVIIGMGETSRDIIQTAKTLKSMAVVSIPINFYIPIQGTRLPQPDLSPEYCLRVLCLYRFLNPSAEIRIAAGREIHLRSLQPLALYPANSLFVDGYLNVNGSDFHRTITMIQDAGFTIKPSSFPVETPQKDLSGDSLGCAQMEIATQTGDISLKSMADLRPFQPVST
jgi:biotin synthase